MLRDCQFRKCNSCALKAKRRECTHDYCARHGESIKFQFQTRCIPLSSCAKIIYKTEKRNVHELTLHRAHIYSYIRSFQPKKVNEPHLNQHMLSYDKEEWSKN